MHRPPLMQNYVGVIDGSILCHRQFNNIHINGHGDGPTLGLFWFPQKRSPMIDDVLFEFLIDVV